MKSYVCDSCGACCRHSILEFDAADVLREPRIAIAGRKLDGKGTLNLPVLDVSWSVQEPRDGEDGWPCTFLGADNRCGIYSTRPACCVDFVAGSDQCQMFRASAKLPPLQQTEVESDIVHEIHAAVLALESEEEQ